MIVADQLATDPQYGNPQAIASCMLQTCKTVYSSLQTARRDMDSAEMAVHEPKGQGVDGGREYLEIGAEAAGENEKSNAQQLQRVTRRLSELDLPLPEGGKLGEDCPPSPRTGRRLHDLGKKLITSALRKANSRKKMPPMVRRGSSTSEGIQCF